MKSVEVLKKIKERVLQQRKVVGDNVRVHVMVAMGTCGIASGARDTIAAIRNEIENKHVFDVVVSQTGCMGLCESEPVVQIKVGGNAPVTYGKIDAERVPQLIEKHVLQGEVVTEWLVK
jgi:NADP-reducing hydrogenase subunit HndB